MNRFSFPLDEDLTKNIDVESYFEPLTVKVKEVDPFWRTCRVSI